MQWEGKRPINAADFDQAKVGWASVGWQEIPSADEPSITASWIKLLEQDAGVVRIPTPSRQWRRISVAELGERAEEIEADFTLKVLAAFRRCTRPAERLLAIDWQHGWYYFDPHAGITTVTRNEWAMPILPDGDSYNYVAPDFRFGSLTVGTGWDQNWSVSLFGAELLAAFAADPPERFLRACGPGQMAEAEQSAPADGGRHPGS